jgi:hypothetical protein
VAKYDPLFEKLCRADDGELELTIDEIDGLVRGLPASATRYRSWWANEVDRAHVQAGAWINAGREVLEVDLARRVVRFSEARWRRGS